MKVLKKIFSIENSENKTHKILTVLGIKIKFKNVILSLLVDIQNSINKVLYMQNFIYSLYSVIKACHVHPNTFGKYKGCNEGKDVVLVCGGPSIKYFEPIDNAVYATVNNGCLYDKVKFDYLFLQELHENKGKNLIVNNYSYKNCQKFYGIIAQKRLSEVYPSCKLIPPKDFDANNVKRYYLDDILNYKFAYDLTTEPIGDFGGTAFSAIQFLLWTRPKRIYLAGVDCSSAGNAFHENKEVMHLECHIESWKKLKQFKDDCYPSVEIISINPVGLKGVFKDIYTESFTKAYLENAPKKEVEVV